MLSTPCWSLLLLFAGMCWNTSEVQAQAITFSYVFDGQVLTGTSTQSGATANNATYGAGLGTKTFFTGNPGDAVAGDGFASGTPLNTANNDYFSFSFTASACSTVTLTSLSFDGRRSGTGPANQEIRYSGNGYATSLFSSTLSGTNFESKSGTLPNLVIPAGQTLEFRLYGFNATGTTGTLRVDNMKFNGTIAAALPSAFLVTGGGEICPPAGAPVGLSGSQVNVNYQLRLNGSPIGAPVPGTGNALGFGDQTGLGTYTVVATNTNGCTSNQSGSVSIAQSSNCGGCSVALNTTQVDVLCNGSASGSIDLTPSGGVSPYTYLWTGGVSTEDRSNLSAGTYFVTVTDATQCTKTTSVTITQPSAISLGTTQTNVVCDALGAIDLTPSGGTPAYTYFWTGGATTQDLSGLAAGTYTVTVTDANNCTKTTSVTITQSNSISLNTTQVNVLCHGNATGSIDLTPSGTAPYTYDWSNDGPESPDNDAQDLFNLLAGTYTVTVTDANSCTAVASVTIAQPDLPLQWSSIPTNPSNCFVADGAIDLSVSGGTGPYNYDWSNDGPESPDNDPQDLQNLLEGTYTVSITDANGCTATEVNTLDYIDVVKPTITCPENANIVAGANCSSAIGSYTPAFLSDNCSANPTLVQSPVSSTIVNAANPSQLVTLRATDSAGNSESCSFTVTLVDGTAPSITCPADQIVNANTACTGTIGAWSPVSVSDNCGGNATVQQSPASSTILSGHDDVETVTLTATDATGNLQECSFTVTLKDVTKPSISCPPNVTLSANANCNSAIGTYSPIALSDNCTANPTVMQNPESTTLLIGHNATTTVTLTATDVAGNTQTCSLTVTLKDVTPPSLVCQAFTANLNAAGMVNIVPANVYQSGVDNCGTINLLSVLPNKFSCSNIGANLVTLTANDGNGNSSVCNAIVTVADVTVPVAKCKNITANLGINGNVTVVASAVNNGSTDNCSFSLSLTPSTFNCSNIGQNTVMLRATDGSGNSATCSATVTVKDVSGPTALCKNPTIYLNDLGQATLSIAQVNNGSSDACGIASMSIDETQFNCSNLPGSSWPVKLSLTDVHGNVSSCISNVTVKDLLAPTAICENKTVALGSNGKVSVFGSELAFNSFDNCSVWSYAPAPKVYTTANLGPNNLTVTVKDWSGNAATCVSVVTVVPFGGDNNARPERSAAAAETLGFTVFPNPTNGEATLVFALPTEETFTVRIFDASGRLVYLDENLGRAGENSIPLHLNGYAPGIYLLDVQSEKWKVQKRLVVQQ